MIKAVIFDCFGVLTSEGWLSFKKKYFADQPEKMARASELNRMLDAAKIKYEDGVREIAELAGVESQEVDSMLRDVVPNEELLAYIRNNLKPKYRVGILSNVSGNWLETLFSEDDYDLFDEIALSYQSGVLKPDARSYQDAAASLGLNTQDCVFIDDQPRHCEGARRAGMQAILYKDFEQMKSELEMVLTADAEG